MTPSDSRAVCFVLETNNRKHVRVCQHGAAYFPVCVLWTVKSLHCKRMIVAVPPGGCSSSKEARWKTQASAGLCRPSGPDI